MIYFNSQQAINFQRKQIDNHRITICQLITVDGDNEIVFAQGESSCHPKDNFNKETGRKVALQKALAKTPFDKNQRRQVWNNYFAR